MTLDNFWQTAECPDPENAVEELNGRLKKLTPAEIAEFFAHFCQVHDRAYDWLLWAAAYLIEGGCSDDGFIDFRYGLISRGRVYYETVLKNPDALADLLGEDEVISNEDFGYVASQVYKAKTGKDIPYPDLPHQEAPTGEDWDFDDPQLCAQKLPKLWQRFGEA